MVRRLALVMIVFGCSKSAAPPGPPPPEAEGPRLFTDVEIAAYEKNLMARLAETAARPCPRPVVREPGTDGPAAPDLIVLVEPTGALETCLASVQELLSKKGAKSVDVIAARSPELLALEATCGETLEMAVRKAAAHRDACSPYQIGVRKDPSSWSRLMTAGHLLGLRARLSAEKGTPAYALAMLLDGMAAARDLGRGRVGLVGSMISVATTNILLDQAQVIATTAKLERADLDKLIAGVDALLASEPPFAETMLAERDWFELYYGMAMIADASWVPPGGGWPDGVRPSAGSDGPFDTTPMTKSPRDDGAVMFAAGAKMAADRDKACSMSATLKACHEGLVALGDAASKADSKHVAEELWADLLKSVGSPDATATAHRIRAAIVDVLVNVAHPAFSKYAAKRAEGVARLAALRLHLEILRAGRCPTEADLSGPPYPALRAPSSLGDQVAVSRTDSGDLEVALPEWIESKKPPWRISCQARRQSGASPRRCARSRTIVRTDWLVL